MPSFDGVIDWYIDWLIDRLIGDSIDWLIDWLDDRYFVGNARLIAWLKHLSGFVFPLRTATFPDGTKLITVHHPVVLADGNLELALYGSFLPVPDVKVFHNPAPANVSELFLYAPMHHFVTAYVTIPFISFDSSCRPTIIPANFSQQKWTRLRLTKAGGPMSCSWKVSATGTIYSRIFVPRSIILRRLTFLPCVDSFIRPIQVGSHFHFIEANKFLQFDRARAYGMRLNINAGTAIRFEPGDARKVVLTEIAGRRIIRGGNRLCDGPVSPENLPAIMEKVSRTESVRVHLQNSLCSDFTISWCTFNGSNDPVQWFKWSSTMVQTIQYNGSNDPVPWFKRSSTMVQMIQYNGANDPVQWSKRSSTMVQMIQYHGSNDPVQWFKWSSTMVQTIQYNGLNDSVQWHDMIQ